MSYTRIVVPATTREMVNWCRAQFGKAKGPDGTPKWHEMRWYCRVTRFYFKDEKDAMFFSLRWQ